MPANGMSKTAKRRRGVSGGSKPLLYVVDDDALLVDLADAVLRQEGFGVRKFTDPEKAFKSFAQEKTKPALLLTDYAMGKMNGLELIEKCKALHPALKTVLVSGTAGAEIILTAPVKVDRFLGKPYQPTVLRDLVNEVLAE